MQLRLTRRALEDLGLSLEDHCKHAAKNYVNAHEAVKAFVERRSQNPNGQEWTKLPVTNISVSNLHHGRLRGDLVRRVKLRGLARHRVA